MSLGTLGTLPGELRRLIWQNFVVPRTPVLRVNSTTESSVIAKRRLAVLETSQQICDEVTAELEQEYNRRVSLDLYPDQEQVIVRNFPHLTFDDFRHTDFSIFKNITMTIFAPDGRDPGQFVRARTFVARLVAMLRRSKTPPDIQVTFRESGFAWCTNGVATNSLADLTYSRYFKNSDIEELLNLFQTLGNTGTKRILLPPGAEMLEGVLHVASSIETDAPSPCAYGSDRVSHVEIGTVLLEIELDRLKGPTASMVRWERFRNWDTYYQEIRETADRVMQPLWNVVHVDVHLMQLSNDYSYFSDIQLPSYDEDPSWSPEDPWRWTYPDGIPAKDTLEWDYAMLSRDCYWGFLSEEEDCKRRARMDHHMEFLDYNGYFDYPGPSALDALWHTG